MASSAASFASTSASMALGMRIAIKFALDLVEAAQDEEETVGGGSWRMRIKRPYPQAVRVGDRASS